MAQFRSSAGVLMVSPRQQGKSASAFRTISEVAEELDVPQHVLRFWETKFSQVRPLKRGGGRRYYRPEDIELLKRIRDFLYRDGYTIKGVQKLLKEGVGKKGALEESTLSVEDDSGVSLLDSDFETPETGTAGQKEGRNLSQQFKEMRSILDELSVLSSLLKSRG